MELGNEIFKNEIKIGYLCFFEVVKVLPNHDHCLCRVNHSQILALLPQQHALRKFRLGDTGYAAIFNINGARVTLSQVSVHYTRRILEYLLQDILKTFNLKIKKSAWVRGSQYRKVAIESLDHKVKDSFELYKLMEPYLKEIDFSKYFNEKISFVCYDTNICTYVKNALCPPGDPSKIYKVTWYPIQDKIRVIADDSVIGLLRGKHSINLTLAKKLCKKDIELLSVNTETAARLKEHLELKEKKEGG